MIVSTPPHTKPRTSARINNWFLVLAFFLCSLISLIPHNTINLRPFPTLRLIPSPLSYSSNSSTPSVLFPPSNPSNTNFLHHYENITLPRSAFRIYNPAVARPRYLQAPIPSVHRLAIQFFIDDYLAMHARHRYNGSRYLIYSPLRAGVGDRMQNLLYAYFIAVLSKRIFLVDWVHPFALSELLSNARPRLNLFYDHQKDPKRLVCAREERNTKHVFFMNGTVHDALMDQRMLMSTIRTVVAKRNGHPRSLTETFLAFNPPRGISRSDAHTIRGHVDLQRVVYHHVFQLSSNIRTEHIRLSKSLGLRNGHTRGGEEYIGVHARVGKGVGEDLGRFYEIARNPRKAAKCLTTHALRLAARSRPPVKAIFLATDTPAFRQTMQDVVKEMTGGQVRVVSGGWDVKHSNRLTPSFSEEPANKTERITDVLRGSHLDLVMLGHARHIVALYSSFPRLAAIMGDTESLTEVRNELCMQVDQWS